MAAVFDECYRAEHSRLKGFMRHGEVEIGRRCESPLIVVAAGQYEMIKRRDARGSKTGRVARVDWICRRVSRTGVTSDSANGVSTMSRPIRVSN